MANENNLLQNTDSFNVTLIQNEPAMSELMLNKYDVVVIDKGQGKYEINSIKNAPLTDSIRFAIEHPGVKLPSENERGIGTNILGYLTLFILLQGVMFIMPYSDDKESGVFKRIGSSPVNTGMYLAAHGLFNFLLVFICSCFSCNSIGQNFL